MLAVIISLLLFIYDLAELTSQNALPPSISEKRLIYYGGLPLLTRRVRDVNNTNSAWQTVGPMTMGNTTYMNYISTNGYYYGGGTTTTSGPKDCWTGCFEGIENEFVKIFAPGDSVTSSYSATSVTNTTYLTMGGGGGGTTSSPWATGYDVFCGIYKSGLKCSEYCLQNDATQYIKLQLQFIQTMCVKEYDGFKKNLPCIIDVEGAIGVDCTNNCVNATRWKSIGTSLATSPNLQQDKMAEMQQVIRENCVQIKCHVSCLDSMLTRRCGNEASRLNKLLYNWSLEDLYNVSKSIHPANSMAVTVNECVPI